MPELINTKDLVVSDARITIKGLQIPIYSIASVHVGYKKPNRLIPALILLAMALLAAIKWSDYGSGQAEAQHITMLAGVALPIIFMVFQRGEHGLIVETTGGKIGLYESRDLKFTREAEESILHVLDNYTYRVMGLKR